MPAGPMPMLRAIRQYAIEHDIPAYISLEERMAAVWAPVLAAFVKRPTRTRIPM